jgi:hypothetical protein
VLTDRAGTVYLAPIADRVGRSLADGKTYKLRVPKNVRAKQFWSLTVYERATWAFIRNPLDRAGLGSFNLDTMKTNADRPWARSATFGSGFMVTRRPSGARRSKCPM